MEACRFEGGRLDKLEKIRVENMYSNLCIKKSLKIVQGFSCIFLEENSPHILMQFSTFSYNREFFSKVHYFSNFFYLLVCSIIFNSINNGFPLVNRDY